MTKLKPNSRMCVFLGYGESGEMSYWLWDPKPRKVLQSNDMFFNEAKFHYQPQKVEGFRRIIQSEDGPSSGQ